MILLRSALFAVIALAILLLLTFLWLIVDMTAISGPTLTQALVDRAYLFWLVIGLAVCFWAGRQAQRGRPGVAAGVLVGVLIAAVELGAQLFSDSRTSALMLAGSVMSKLVASAAGGWSAGREGAEAIAADGPERA